MLTKLTAGRPFYIVLDAMDECKLDIRNPLLNALKSITEDVRILVTARLLEKRDELSEGFDKLPITAQTSDVDEYIEFMISEDSELRKCSRDDIKRTVRRKAGGMFLLVRLHMHALSNLDSPEEIADALANLPKTVDESYANAIARVNTKDPQRKLLARIVLAWMSYTFRPLKFQELSHAIAAQTSGPIIEKHRLLPKERITSVCCGLVEIDMDDIVRFVHYSAQSFFVQRKESEFGASRLDIPLACAKYLCMDVLEQPVDSKDSEESIEHRPNSEKLESYPFAEYAAEYLHKHFQLVRNDNDRTEKHVELNRYIRRLVNEEPKRNFYCNLLRDLQAYYTHSVVLEGRYSQSGRVDATPLHLAVFLGSCHLVRSLLDRPNSNVNELDGSEQTPLVIAFKRDFGDIAEILLDHGATVDLSTKQGHVLLLYAAQRNHEKAVEKILRGLKQTELPWSLFDLGVLLVAPLILILCFLHQTLMKSDGSTIPAQPPSEKEIHIPDDNEMDPLLERYGRALILAYEGHSHALDEFLATHPFDVDDCDHKDQVTRSDSWDSSSSGVSSNRCDGIRAQDFLNTACFLAVEGGHTSTVEVLLNRGVSADLENSHGQPLLHRATFRNNIGLVELILDKGATVDLEDENKRTVFTAHASIEREEVLRFLQSKGADINHTGGYEKVHELYRAAAFGNIEMVEFFLDAGVSASITNIYSWAPLHEASANGHLECVRLLFNKGAYPSPISDVGKTPLDLVNSGELHYDWPCLGEDSEHYLNGEVYKKKEEDLQDIERKEQIRDLLLEKGAKTADQLYAEDRSQFEHVSPSYLPDSPRYETDYESD
ncbi:Ankyrin repeat protein [Lasiodiplodia theobromae]|uniref:Ankyrin repeat protein n=1 Tax=Lasiodiplodia theobromae TaxID=45133 RepID=A0A8H7IRJ3_9PEZI|nr:Ankyrin repeat protein [Lasiodiplodia theobromae]